MNTAALNQWLAQFRRSTKTDAQGRQHIGYRSIYILPTKQGILFAVLLVLMLTGSINYGSNLGYLVTFLLGGIWLTSILHTWRNLLGIRVAPLKAAPIFAGQPAGFSLLLENPSNLPRFSIGVSVKGGSTATTDLTAKQAATVELSLSSEKRGLLTLPRVSIYSRYPLGLFYAWTYAQPEMSCLVYPRPAGSGEAPLIPAYARSDAGDQGQGADDFIDLRNFRYGDSPRHIDWKALARERGLYSKLFGGDRTNRITLDWDRLSDPDPEMRLSQLCRFLLLAHEHQFSYDLKLPGVYISQGMDEPHKNHCLAALATFGLS